MTTTVSPLRRIIGLAIALTTVVTLGGAAAHAAPTSTSGDTGTAGATVAHRLALRVDGAVGRRLHLSNADLARLPQRTITLTYQSGSGPQTHTYTGPLLLDVLNRAQPRFDPQIKNHKLRHVVTATGSDRYQAAFAWGEIDPDFEGKTVLVAITEDGQPTADGRPRVVVPGDRHGGRYVSSLVSLQLTAPRR
ncbi:molybdopterin-dependent oxidoreductase [Micromonospora sp. NBC_01699]|uniref:molybdopterin-dependent oxidoreductase n=1 Tax=Micromonospora sp. NBC_01699 TaxID=2975984 RepID=UPI002E2DADFF|nr:molybdopterin-dependent oxidoreductase [Micromonospora sp. NBC_01699]